MTTLTSLLSIKFEQDKVRDKAPKLYSFLFPSLPLMANQKLGKNEILPQVKHLSPPLSHPQNSNNVYENWHQLPNYVNHDRCLTTRETFPSSR